MAESLLPALRHRWRLREQCIGSFPVPDGKSTLAEMVIEQYPDAIYLDLERPSDRNKRNAQFLLLGSASRDLIKQSSESLAGRVSYLEITPFTRTETKYEPASGR